MAHSTLTVGEFARCAGLNPKTIRYYEEISLLSQLPRNLAGYRQYVHEDLERLRFIQREKLLGLPLVEVKQLADFAEGGQCHSLRKHLLALVQKKLVEEDRHLVELATLRDDLRRFRIAIR